MEKERVSVIVTEDTAKRFCIAPVFRFQQDMTLQEAAEAVSGMIQENGGYLPVEWFQFAEKPNARQKDTIFG